jgi:hypothetical protein
MPLQTRIRRQLTVAVTRAIPVAAGRSYLADALLLTAAQKV